MLSSAQAYSDLLQQLGDTNDWQSPSIATESKYLTNCLLHGLYYTRVEQQIHLRTEINSNFTPNDGAMAREDNTSYIALQFCINRF